ncbi:family 43 glycosylhydrolase [Hymenobacter sp. BT175]|uniref:family 43 glycosylhydrolase n=1 Tax=Hymenobacter translucens TaxID=2886507 RepID=UPI001D0EF5C4|nr:family 43 glycosylhydrolase [Hymenobacter translucens]MCC2545337.1 family 43 glycosylhydrolase [Hymenobacter translucens]
MTTLRILLLLCGILGLSGCSSRVPGGAGRPAAFTNPILPGDFPDPSVTRIGRSYWVSATSSNWAPAFPLLKSDNLRDWTLVGHVFPDSLPSWADAYFWAPEISQEGRKTYVYYTARRKDGILCVAVASADSPAGPYHDHGPLIGQAAGSIDGFPVRDEKGELYLVWKEDGNSRNQPTPIWAQRMNEERTALLGAPVELFRNDSPWEGSLIEGVAMVRHAGWLYAFYAGNGCCGAGCTYALGIARARTLRGPWQKYSGNPVLTGNDTWKCPGHGTPVQYGGRWFLLHHAYHAGSQQYVGRQGVLTEFTWGSDGWPVFPARGMEAGTSADPLPVRDDFTGEALAPGWQWPLGKRPRARLQEGSLVLGAEPEGALLVRPTLAATYSATTQVQLWQLTAGARAGLVALGSPENAVSVTVGEGRVQVWQRSQGRETLLSEAPLPTAATVRLRLQARAGSWFRFDWSSDDGQNWQPLGSREADGQQLPAWDGGIRVGLLVSGPREASARFSDFQLN